MDTMPWHKIETTRVKAIMAQHPNNIVGMWFRVWCTLADNKKRWKLKADLETWCRITGENGRETRRFFNYINDHIVDMTVKTQHSPDGVRYIIEDEYQQVRYSSDRTKRTKTKKVLKTPLREHRETINKDIFDAYHPNRKATQHKLFSNQLLRVLRETSSELKSNNDKIRVEKDKATEILAYINFLKTTNEWRDEGTYLLGIGKFMQSRPWEYDERFLKGKTKQNNTVKEQIMDELELEIATGG